MRERSIGIQELHANLGRCLDEVRGGTTLLLTDGEHRVARLIPEPAAGPAGGGPPIAWSGRRLKKAKDSDRYKSANCAQTRPVFYGFLRLARGKVIPEPLAKS